MFEKKPKGSFWLFAFLLFALLLILIGYLLTWRKTATADSTPPIPVHQPQSATPKLSTAKLPTNAVKVPAISNSDNSEIAKLSPASATQLFAKGDYQQAINVAKYVLETRLGDEYWLEAIPALTASSLKTKQEKDLLIFAIAQITRDNPDYPEETERIQESLSMGFLASILQDKRPDVALELIAAIRASTASDAVKEVAAAYADRIKQFGESE